MKTYCKALVVTAVVSALSLPALAKTPSNSSSAVNASTNQPGAREAMKMVPAKAMLSRTLDADKDHPNTTIEANLRNKVTLSNGTVLPSNTTLIGKITNDDMQETGTSKLALRFTQARLKDGKIVPIKATIVDIVTPNSYYGAGGMGDNMPNSWTDGTLAVDQVGVLSGVDLHSKIASQNSGVFVSAKKHDVKLPSGSELQLAIAPAMSSSMASS